MPTKNKFYRPTSCNLIFDVHNFYTIKIFHKLSCSKTHSEWRYGRNSTLRNFIEPFHQFFFYCFANNKQCTLLYLSILFRFGFRCLKNGYLQCNTKRLQFFLVLIPKQGLIRFFSKEHCKTNTFLSMFRIWSIIETIWVKVWLVEFDGILYYQFVCLTAVWAI